MFIADSEKTTIDAISVCRDGVDVARLLSDKNIRIFCRFGEEKILIWGADNREAAVTCLVSMLSILNRLRDERLIYVVNDDSRDFLLLTSGNYTFDLGYDSEDESYYSDQLKVRLSEPFVDAKINREPLAGVFIIDGVFARDLCYWLRSVVYPTEDLIRIVDNGYKDEEERRFDKTINLTHWSIGIAIFALVLSMMSPLLSTTCSNRYGYSTLKTAQFDSIYNVLDSIKIHIDTLDLSQRDSCRDAHARRPKVTKGIK